MHDSPGPAADVLRFGDFAVDPRSGDLRGAGGRVTLPEQPLQILLSLLEHPGEVVSRDTLRHRLWPDDTFVDFEHGLNAAVKRLRDVLGDSADVPRYIETIPRRGYRLIAPVATAPAESVTATTGPQETGGAGSRTWPRLAAGAVLLVMTLGFLAWRATRTPPAAGPVTPPPPLLTRLTFGEGLQTDVTWSPDGTRIAYASDRSGDMDIWVQALDGSDPVAVGASPYPDSQPAWSPRGDQIVFRSERDGGGLFLVAATGGPARRLTTFGFHPSWYPDGTAVAFISTDLPGTFERSLYSVVPDGVSKPREILKDFLRSGRWASLRPRADGRMTAIGFHRSEGFGIFAIGLDGGIVDVTRPPGALKGDLGLDAGRPVIDGRWAPDGTALYLQATALGLSSVWRVPATRFAPRWDRAERLTSGPGRSTAMAVAPDGHRVAFTAEVRRTRAWVFPFDPILGKLTGPGRPVTPQDTNVGNLRLLPDGSLLFSATREGRQQTDVMVTDLESGTTKLVASNAGGVAASPDGGTFTYRLYRSRPGTDEARPSEVEFAAAVMDRSGSERLISDWSAGLVVTGDWLADGSAAITSHWNPFPDGGVSLVLWPLTGGVQTRPQRVLLADPNYAFWQAGLSPDQKFVSFVAAFTGQPGLALGVMPMSDVTGRWTRLTADHEWADKPRWAPDGRTLYFISRKPSGYYNLWGIRLDPRTARPISAPFQISSFDRPAMSIEPNMSISDVSMAGGRLAVTMRSASGSIWMMSSLVQAGNASHTPQEHK